MHKNITKLLEAPLTVKPELHSNVSFISLVFLF